MGSGRLLFVHAHPDDESITTGATMARHVERGDRVTLLTCTLGEEGEIFGDEYAGLAAGRADQLGGYRIAELSRAAAALGLTDHRFLGGAGRFRDSGMAGAPSHAHPRAFARAGTDPGVFEEAVALAVDVVREVRPHVVVTYDAQGDYGHPDHVMAHRVTEAAVERAADPTFGSGQAWQVPKVYWTATPKSVLAADGDAIRAASGVPFTAGAPDAFGYGVDDAAVTCVVDAEAHVAAKTAALRAHATQIAVWGDFYALSNLLGRRIRGIEHFRLARGAPAPVDDTGLETDLLAGLEQ